MVALRRRSRSAGCYLSFVWPYGVWIECLVIGTRRRRSFLPSRAASRIARGSAWWRCWTRSASTTTRRSGIADPGDKRRIDVGLQAMLRIGLENMRFCSTAPWRTVCAPLDDLLSLFFDLRNAFWSIDHGALDSAIAKVVPFGDRRLLRNRVHDFDVFVPGGADEAGVLLRIGSGVPPGDSWASELFASAYNPAIDRFLGRTSSCAIPCWAFVGRAGLVLGRLCHGLRGRHATHRASGPPYAAGRSGAHLRQDIELDAELGPLGMSQNHSKKDVVPFLTGRGSREQARRMYKEGVGGIARVRHTVKYLGFQCSYNGTSTADREARIRALRCGYHSMRGFWVVAPRQLAKLAFRSVCLSPLLSGWSVVSPTGADLKRMEGVLMGYARKLLHGRASGKQVCDNLDGGPVTVYKSMPNSEVCRVLGFSALSVELLVSRLRFWQGVFARPVMYDSLLAPLFGSVEWSQPVFDNDRQLTDSAPPWAHQLDQDVQKLFALDCGGGPRPRLRLALFSSVGRGGSGGLRRHRFAGAAGDDSDSLHSPAWDSGAGIAPSAAG